MNPSQPAIVRKEQRSIDALVQCCSNGFIATVAQAQTWLSNHRELHLRYREKWSSWEDACQAVYKMSRQALHKRVVKLSADFSQEDVCQAPCQPQVDGGSSPSSSTNRDLEQTVNTNLPDENQTQTPQENVPEPEPETDDLGRVIPEHCLEMLGRVKVELQPLITAASKIHAWADKLGDTGYDPLFAFIFDGHRQDTVEYSHHIQHLFSTCKPERVCPRCDGIKQAAKRCETCLGAGMISQYRWTHHVIAGTDPKLADKAKAIMVNATKGK